jgi:hypothetical protein
MTHAAVDRARTLCGVVAVREHRLSRDFPDPHHLLLRAGD